MTPRSRRWTAAQWVLLAASALTIPFVQTHNLPRQLWLPLFAAALLIPSLERAISPATSPSDKFVSRTVVVMAVIVVVSHILVA
jgi:hypothetical protein